MNSNIHLNQIEDQVDFFQLGQTDEDNFVEYTIELPEPSSWSHWPHKYKFIGLELFFHYDKL